MYIQKIKPILLQVADPIIFPKWWTSIDFNRETLSWPDPSTHNQSLPEGMRLQSSSMGLNHLTMGAFNHWKIGVQSQDMESNYEIHFDHSIDPPKLRFCHVTLGTFVNFDGYSLITWFHYPPVPPGNRTQWDVLEQTGGLNGKVMGK